MALHLSEPKIIERGPYRAVGVYAVCEGDDESWGKATGELIRRQTGIRSRVGDTQLGFLYRPRKDDPS